MARHRRFNFEFKRQVVLDVLEERVGWSRVTAVPEQMRASETFWEGEGAKYYSIKRSRASAKLPLVMCGDLQCFIITRIKCITTAVISRPVIAHYSVRDTPDLIEFTSGFGRMPPDRSGVDLVCRRVNDRLSACC